MILYKIQSSRRKSLKPLKMNDLRDFLYQTGTKPEQSIESFFSLHYLLEALQEVCKEKKIMFFHARPYVDYKPPKLHCSGPEWYVYYSIRNRETGKFRRYRVKVNRGSVKERKEAARQIIASIAEKLSVGWTPALDGAAPLATVPIFDALDAFERVKSKEMRKQSLDTYRSYLRVFRRWLEGNRADGSTAATSFDAQAAVAYMDYLEDREDISPRSFNNYLSFMVTLFDWMKDKGYATDNPFLKIKRKPKRLMKKKRRTLTEEELATLFGFLAENNPAYMAVCLLCYCCFMRPKEIALLRCCDIDLARQVVHVAADVSKNGKESFRTIPSAAVQLLRSLDLSRPHFFVFGKHDGVGDDFSPGREPTAKKKFSDYWNTRVREACGFGDDLQLYSLKDTGITRMLGENVPISFVQQQADHSSVAMTALYIGKSALAVDELRGVDILPK